MALALQILVYLSILVFLVAVAYRIVRYLRNPMHVRWELYPVAHEGKRSSYGGGYLEDVDWWKKPQENSKIGELKVMIPEILLLKAVWENNRSLWFVTYPFHLGLYFAAALLGLIFIEGVLLKLSFVTSVSVLYAVLHQLVIVIGPLSFGLCLFGALGLFVRRLTDTSLRNYSSFGHFFNLLFFAVVMILAITNWVIADDVFVLLRETLINLLLLNVIPQQSGLFTIWVMLSAALLAYIPLTHMSHFFMKYFLYHDIRWGDKPNINQPDIDARIQTVLNYPVTWSASHIHGGDGKTWADVAMFNPMQQAEAAKETGK
jgi:nitrate reductase gamma subunit